MTISPAHIFQCCIDVVIPQHLALHCVQDLVDSVLLKVTDLSIDCIVAFGGGSSIGLGKALTLATGCKGNSWRELLPAVVPAVHG